jgi:transglycosylase-like protein with SLT domain
MPMNAARELLRRLAARLQGKVGARVFATLAALLLLVLTGTLVLANLTGGGQRTAGPLARSADTAVATDTPSPTATLSPTPRPTRVVQAPKPPPIPTKPPATPTPKPTGTTGGTPAPTPTPCGPGAYQGGNPTQDQLRTALAAAAAKYGLPANLLYAVAWQESRWHQDVVSCDGGIGLMQIQDYTAPWLNTQSVPVCGLAATTYDVHQYQDNALLGAKFLKWLYCFYSYWGNNGGTSVSNPGAYTAAWYYKNASLQYPDTKNADGTTNPNSLCAAVFADPTKPWYPQLPSMTADPWSCPYNATKGDTTVLDITVSAYNEGPGNVSKYGINNWWYVQGVEGYVPQFASGALPKPS